VQLQGLRAQQRLKVDDPSAVGQARRDAQRLAQDLGLDDTAAGRVAIVATELANNLVRHAGGGEIFLQGVEAVEGGQQVELLAIDQGPGMSSLDQCLRDGFSTGGTPGTGLGAVKRLSASFDAYSQPGRGSVLMARVGAGRTTRFGAVCTPVRGEEVPGDGWRIASREGLWAAIVLDGLGHGPLAAAASTPGLESFAQAPFDTPQIVLERVHGRLSGTRGAAGACVQRSPQGQLSFAGVGNISGRSFGSASGTSSVGLPSHNGTLGLQVRRIQQFEYEAKGGLIVLHSDGLTARWDLDQYEGLRYRHPAVIAGVLYREHRRERDDATVVVIGDE
jgi:anti-sigma regulatory factor (Ser/Thr protein kinase)